MTTGSYRIATLGQQLGIGVAGSQYVTIQAVAKANGPNAPYCVPNELICGVIGRFLGLPIPPSGIVEAPNSPTPILFASLDFNLVGDALPPVDPAVCIAIFPDLSTGLLLFDALVANCDRNRGNLAVDSLATPPRMNFFDHSHALFGFDEGQGLERLKQLRERLGLTGGRWMGVSRHCLLNVIDTDAHFGKWLDRIEKLPDFFIEDSCHSAVDLGIDGTEAASAVDFICYRRDHLRGMIEESRQAFSSIDQWSLIS